MFTHLWGQLRKEGPGLFAVQIPNNFRAPSHTLIRDTLYEGVFGQDESEREHIWSLLPRVHDDGALYYYHLLRPLARHVDVWETEYLQVLPVQSPYHPVLEWTSSTALAPILSALPSDQERDRFRLMYSQKLHRAYPVCESAMGVKQVVFPFKRIFMIAMR